MRPPRPPGPFEPAAATLRDGTVAEVFVLAGGAVSVRLAAADGTEVVGDFTERETARLLADVEARRASVIGRGTR